MAMGRLEIAPRRGDAIDRFTVLEPLGAVGTGVLVSAYDPTLDRRVAIKLLPPAAPDEERMRPLHEAQAMARLSHPNVIAVYEVGTAGDEVFVAMELVDGETLAERLTREPRGWRVVLGLFVEAGRGLAAAHRAGLVHRDFRTENVLVAKDGTVRVTDFKMGGDADARSDQFRFCSTLHDALPADAPRWLRGAVSRGLQAEPRERWPSMDALVAALERDPAAARRRWLARGAVVAAAAAAAVVWIARAERDPCPPAQDKVSGIWDAPARDRVRAAFLATGRADAADVFARAEQALDARLAAWVAGHAEACRATRVRGEQSGTMLDLRMQCLERARRQIQALPELWQEDIKLDDAVRAALTTGELEACSDTAALATPVPPPRDPDAARSLEALKRKLDRVAALWRAGRMEAGLALAREAVTEARRVGYAPTLAEALHRNAQLETEFGTLEVGLALFYEAYRTAAEARDDVRAATTMRLLLRDTVYRARRFADAPLLWTMAEAALVRAGGRDDLAAELLATQGTVLAVQGRPDEAAEHLRRALAGLEALRGPDHFDLASVLFGLAAVEANLGHMDASLALNDRARAIWERTLGPEHPYVAGALQYDAGVRQDKGDYEGAAAAAERVVAIRSKVSPADSLVVGKALYSLAVIRASQERDDEAQALLERTARIGDQDTRPGRPLVAAAQNALADLALERGDNAAARKLVDLALASTRKAYGDDNATVAVALVTLGTLRLRENDRSGARAAFERALSILRKVGEHHPDVALPLRGLGEVALAEGKLDMAVVQFEAARALLEGSPGGQQHPRLVPILTGLGQARIEDGHAPSAVAILERAAALADAKGIGKAGARARFQLARALWESGEPARATALARSAREALSGRHDVDDVDRWLREHTKGIRPSGSSPRR